MKKVVKLISVVLSVLLILSAFSGCSNNDKEVSTGSKYTYWVSLDSTAAQTLTSYSEKLMYQEAQKELGIEIEFLHPASGSTGSEAFQILLASGDFPDMINTYWKNYSGGGAQAIEDGVIIGLKKYMEDYAPNYYDWMEGKKGKENDYVYKKESITDKGDYYGFKTLKIGGEVGHSGPFIRKDLLDKWGFDVPVTIDDWEEILKVAKKEGYRKPVTGIKEYFNLEWGVYHGFNSAWNIAKGVYVNDGKVVYGPFQKEYKEYVAKMADWFKKGYMDIDYITNKNEDIAGNMCNDISIAAFGYVGGDMGKILPAAKEKNPDFELVACPFPVLNEGDTSWVQEYESMSNEPCTAISVQCGQENEDRYKEAIRWCDYFYSEEGAILANFGVEGVTYTIEKGEDGKDHYVYTDSITDHEKIGAHSVEAAMHHFFMGQPGLFGFEDYTAGFYPYPQQIHALKVWNQNYNEAKNHKFPNVPLTTKELETKAHMETYVQNNLNATLSNIIMGKEPMSNYDAAVQKAKDEGFTDYLKMMQKAYDKYMAASEE